MLVVCLYTLQEFIHWLCVMLLEVLLPGASFSKCLMSLHLLCLLGQIFTFSSGTPAAHEQHTQSRLYLHHNTLLFRSFMDGRLYVVIGLKQYNNN